MATPKDVLEYPKQYGDLFIKSCKAPTEVPCESAREANLLRSRLYAYRESIFCSPYTLPAVTLVASLLTFQIKGSVLIVKKKVTLEEKIIDALKAATPRSKVPSLPRQHDDNDKQDVLAEVLS